MVDKAPPINDQSIMDGDVSIIPELNKALPLHPAYASESIARRFWRVAFKPARKFSHSQDVTGREVLWPHPREAPDSYARRKQSAKGPNFVGPIINQYNDFAFRKKPERDSGGSPEYQRLIDDADGYGTSMDRFMRKALRKAQVEQVCYLMPVNPANDDIEIVTVADAEQAGAKPRLRILSADAVINWVKVDGFLKEALIIITVDGKPVARHLTETERTDYKLKRLPMGDNPAGNNHGTSCSYEAVSKGETVEHGYVGVPLVPVEPNFDDIDDCDGNESQACPIAELQQAFWNLDSWQREELWNCAFSMYWVAGAAKPETNDKSTEVITGTSKIMWFTEAATTFNRIANDPVAFESLKEAKEECRTSLYTVAGLESADPGKSKLGLESGVALAFKFQNLAAKLSALVDACESSENQAMDMVADAWGFSVPKPAKYPDNFDIPDYGSELLVVIQACAGVGIPSVLKKIIVDRFVNRNCELTDDEQAELDDQMEARSDIAESSLAGLPPPKLDADGNPIDPAMPTPKDPTDPTSVDPAAPKPPKPTTATKKGAATGKKK